MQRARMPVPGASSASVGRAFMQSSTTYLQRGANRHPLGRSSRPGTIPGSAASRFAPALCSGIAASNASVYG